MWISASAISNNNWWNPQYSNLFNGSSVQTYSAYIFRNQKHNMLFKFAAVIFSRILITMNKPYDIITSNNADANTLNTWEHAHLTCKECVKKM